MLQLWLLLAMATDTPAPTYSKEVSRIIQKNCENCHRPGQVGPFALTSYDEARAFVKEIKRVTQARGMPPWHAVRGYGEFKNERRLSDADIDAIARWVDAGAPRGNRSRPVANLGIRIPASAENHKETAHWTLSEDLLAYSVAPHMHLLGKEMLVTATLPDGAQKSLVWAKPYVFNWQTGYVFKEPIPLPKGTRIDVTGYFDNSEKNPNNPNKPLREVR